MRQKVTFSNIKSSSKSIRKGLNHKRQYAKEEKEIKSI